MTAQVTWTRKPADPFTAAVLRGERSRFDGEWVERRAVPRDRPAPRQSRTDQRLGLDYARHDDPVPGGPLPRSLALRRPRWLDHLAKDFTGDNQP